MSSRAVIYLRVSSDDQVRGVSLDVQETVCRNRCEQDGVRVERVFREEGESAKTAHRTQLKAMLAFLRQRKALVQYVYVYDFSRWARDLYDHFTVKRQLMGLGITLRSATQPVADNATGRAIEGYISVTNQFVNELQAEKIVECMQETVRRGRWPWRSPLGYLNGRSATGDKIVTLDPERAELMRMAFRMVADGQAPADVLKRLTAIGLRSRAGRSLRYADFQKLLRNPFYTGIVRAGAWGIETEGQHEPLTDPTTWARVQSRISPRKERRIYLRQHPDFPLRGFVRCEACGKPLTASWSRGKTGTRYGYYRCWSRHCGAVNIAAGKLEEEFSELLRRVQLTPAMARLVEASLMSLWDHTSAPRASALPPWWSARSARSRTASGT